MAMFGLGFYNADDFLSRFMGARLLYLSGKVGTGKTLMGVALSKLLLQEGLADVVVSNVPIAFATPVVDAPLRRVVIFIDELGFFYDARTIVGKSNEFRKAILGFPRKIDAYIIVSSRIVPDKSFRALSVQRDMVAPFGFNRFVYGEDDGVLMSEGNFWVSGLSCLYPFYDTKYIPTSVDSLADYTLRAVQNARGGEDDPNKDYSVDELEVLYGRPGQDNQVHQVSATQDWRGADAGKIQDLEVNTGNNYNASGSSEAGSLSNGRKVLTTGGYKGVVRTDFD